MLKPTLFLLAGLAAGVVTASFWGNGAETLDPVASPVPSGLVARVEALEQALNRETLRRAALESELATLHNRIVQGGAPGPEDVAGRGRVASATGAPLDPEPEPETTATAAGPPESMRRRFGRDGNDDLAARLIEAGFSPDRAEYINARAETLRMEALQAQYEARRDGVPLTPRVFGADPLRAELGDPEYERYLQALGRSTSVRVGGVLASSPAAQAGLEPGDEVVAYAGDRVFDMRELNELILEGQPGEPVTVDVLREGQPIQLVLPRGPLGISGRGRR